MESTDLALFREAVRVVELGLSLTVCVVLARRLRKRRTHTTACAFGIFAVVALVIASGYVQPADPGRGWGAVWSDAVICILLTVPYLLVRFTWVLGGLTRRTHLAAAALLVVEWVVTVVLPPLPQDGEPRPGWAASYIALVLAAWTVQSLVAAVGLWRAGRGQSSVIRHRMRSLAAGGLLLATTLVVSGAASGRQTAVAVSVALLGLLSIVLFALAFQPPSPLRLLWRQSDLAALSTAERGLMTALSGEQVAETIVPVVSQVFGGGAVLLDSAGEPVRSQALTAVQIRRISEQAIAHPQSSGALEPGVLCARLTGGWLVVQGGALAPVFGDDEALLLDRVATLVDLALQRAQLFEQERVSRRSAEAASAELETLLYSVSHDLRSPLISVLGYLDVMRQEFGPQITGDGSHYLERISVNAMYMQSLIADLLELSRIGRNDPSPQPVDLQSVAQQVVEGARMAHPQAHLQVRGTMPVVLLSDVRVRQLLTNLVDNALKHGGRDDLAVTVSGEVAASGVLRVEVSDNGRGIPQEYWSRVLRVFERLDAARATSGTGMGLAICKRIVESFGGTLNVSGPPPGSDSGTTICIELPAGVVVEPRVPRQAVEADARTRVEESA